MDGWVLSEPLKDVNSEDQPYLATAQSSLGGHEVSITHAPAAENPEFRVFLDGKMIFENGMAAPAAAWFRLCQELGYDAEGHWDLDPTLILFRQVLPLMAKGWEENVLPFGDGGLPEGVVSLASVQAAWALGVKALRERVDDPAGMLLADCFERLPLRCLTFHDDPRLRPDFVGNTLDEPYLGVFARLGTSQAQRVTLAKATLHAAGGMKWSPWRIGGDWREGDHDFLSTRSPEAILKAAGLEGALGQVPSGFQEAFQGAVDRLVGFLEPAVGAYQASIPVGIPWHRDGRTRYINRMIVGVRLGEHTVLVLDDGTEVTVMEGSS